MASKRWKVNNFWWHLHILQYVNEQKLQEKKNQTRLPGEREREGREGRRRRCRERERRRAREKQTEAGVNYGCNLRFPRGEKKRGGRKKHQVMHIRLRICDIFLPWSVSRLICNLASLFSVRVCVCVCWSESIYTFIRVRSRGRSPCCQPFAELDTTAACLQLGCFVSSSVRARVQHLHGH